MSRHKFGSEYSAGPTRWVPVGDLQFDSSAEHPIQRGFDEKWATWIGENLDPEQIGILSVSLRKNGKPYVIDGQHRAWGVKNIFGNNGTLVECKVYEGLDRAGEALLFQALNAKRRSVSPLDNFLVSVTAKDPVNYAIDRLVQDVGLAINKGTGDGVVRATGAMRMVYLGFVAPDARKTSDGLSTQPELLRATLLVLKGAWGINRKAYDGSLIEGVGRLLAARWKVVDRQQLAEKLAPYSGGPHALIGVARGRRSLLGGSVAAAVADIAVDVYNKGKRTDKIEPLR